MVVFTKVRPTASPMAASVICAQRFQRGAISFWPLRYWLNRKFSSTNALPSALASSWISRKRRYVFRSGSPFSASTASNPVKNSGTATLIGCTSWPMAAKYELQSKWGAFSCKPWPASLWSTCYRSPCATRGMGARQGRLDAQHGLRLLLRVRLGGPRQLQHRRGELLVAFARLLHLGLVAHVVVAVGQPQPSLVRDPDHVLRVLDRAEDEEAARARVVHLAHQPGDLLRILQRVDGGEALPERLQGGGLGLLLVHAGGVEVADLLHVGIHGVALSGGVLLQDVPQEQLVALVHCVEAARPPRLVGRDGIGPHPAAAGVLVEVVARVGGRIHRALVHGREGRRSGCGLRGSRGRARSGCRRTRGQGESGGKSGGDPVHFHSFSCWRANLPAASSRARRSSRARCGNAQDRRRS